MIKIVYRDLSPGLHASAEVSGRHTIISLLPGLTLNQRRAALRRIRHSGRMGHGPRVPAAGLALAVARDRIKATTRTGAAVVRLHPAGSTLPVVLLSAAAAVFVLMATVSIHVLPGPKSLDQNPVIGGVSPGPTSSAPQIGQSLAPSITIPGDSTRPGQARNGVAGRQPGSGGSAGSSGRSPVGTSGAQTVFGSEPGQTGTGLVTATSAGSGSTGGSGTGTSAGAGTGGSGSSGSGSSGSGGSGTSAGPSGSGTGTTGGSGAGSGTGTTSGSGGTGSSGSGGSGSGTTGSGGSGTGTGSGTGSSGSGSSGSGSSGSGSGSSGGGLCLNLLGVLQACVG